jgi:hypothetical protein
MLIYIYINDLSPTYQREVNWKLCQSTTLPDLRFSRFDQRYWSSFHEIMPEQNSRGFIIVVCIIREFSVV